MTPSFRTTAYRVPNEQLILAVTVIIVILVIALTATATVCLSVVFVLGMLLLSYMYSRSQQRALLQTAQPVTTTTLPVLGSLANDAASRLQTPLVEIYLLPSQTLNAYTFGLSSPKSIVLYSSLLEVMDQDELQFIIGHEMGHVCLGHTWLNSLVGGMAGIPSPTEASYILMLAFRWWNRACEYSADRAGLLACGCPNKAISALVKLEAGPRAYDPETLQRLLLSMEKSEGELLDQVNELLATHPMVVRRIQALRSYISSPQYRQLQALVDQNVRASRTVPG